MLAAQDILRFNLTMTVLFILIYRSFGLAPLRTQKLNKLTKYEYQNFIYLDNRSDKLLQSYISIPNVRIMVSFIKNLPKSQNSLQIVSLGGNGLFQLILLTEANNFENKLVIVKSNTSEFNWLTKNIYVNGLQKDPILLNVALSSQNSVKFKKISAYQLIDYLISPISRCQQCQNEFLIQSRLSKIIELHILPQNKAHQNGRSVHLFIKIQTLSQSITLKNQLIQVFKQFPDIKLQLILQLETSISLMSIIPEHLYSNSELHIYNIGLKISEKITALQFRQIKYRISGPQTSQYQMLEEGIFYITETNSLISK